MQVATDDAPDGARDNPVTFILPAALNAASVVAVAADMREQQLDKQRIVVLDFTQVAALTSPGLQLLVSLEKSLGEVGGTLFVHNVKSGLEAVFRDTGFERFLRPAT